MNYTQVPLFSLADHQEKQLRRSRTTAAVLAVLLFIALIIIFWLAAKLIQTNQDLSALLSNVQQLVSEKAETTKNLDCVKQELAETQAEFEESFNTLYPAFVAVENIRYIGLDSQTYHYFSCPEFSAYSTYSAHNSEYCDKLGYIPCSVCCKR